MVRWVILCFRNDRGRHVFCDEYESQTVAARAKFRATVNVLRDQPTIEGWNRQNGFDRLTGKKYRPYRGLGKLRFKTAEAQHRPIGFFGPKTGTFVLLAWATERDGKFDPPNVLDTAFDRMQSVLKNPELADACDL